jgi:hypothetical protein
VIAKPERLQSDAGVLSHLTWGGAFQVCVTSGSLQLHKVELYLLVGWEVVTRGDNSSYFPVHSTLYNIVQTRACVRARVCVRACVCVRVRVRVCVTINCFHRHQQFNPRQVTKMRCGSKLSVTLQNSGVPKNNDHSIVVNQP